MFGLECTVYMVRMSYDRSLTRMMIHLGAGFSPAKSADQLGTAFCRNAGFAGQPWDRDQRGSEDAATHDDTNYALGSVLNHVMLHQTVIGQEAKLQMEQAGEEPEVVIGCFGGGSNFGGLALPYVLDRLAGKGPRIVAVEPSACPSLTREPWRTTMAIPRN
jgi:tryptophan synthase beta chain